MDAGTDQRGGVASMLRSGTSQECGEDAHLSPVQGVPHGVLAGHLDDTVMFTARHLTQESKWGLCAARPAGRISVDSLFIGASPAR